MATWNTRTYTMAVLLGTDGFAYAQNGVTGVPLLDQMFDDIIHDIASATTIQSLACGAAGGYARSNGSAWVRVSGLDPTDLSAAVPYTKGGTGLTALGTASQVLRVNAGASAIEWGGSGNGRILIETLTASASANLICTTLDTSTYDCFEFEICDLVPASNGNDFYMEGSVDGGSNYGSAWTNTRVYFENGTMSQTSGTGQTQAGLAANLYTTGNSAGLSGFLRLNNGQATNQRSRYFGQAAWDMNTPNRRLGLFGGWYDSASKVNKLKFFMTAGNLTSGIIRVYAHQKA